MNDTNKSFYQKFKSNLKPKYELEFYEDHFIVNYRCDNLYYSDHVNAKFEGVKYNKIKGFENTMINSFLSITAKEYLEMLLTSDNIEDAPPKAENKPIKFGVDIADFIEFANAKNIFEISSIDYIEFSRSSTTILDNTQEAYL
jgi:hypothetical protein